MTDAHTPGQQPYERPLAQGIGQWSDRPRAMNDVLLYGNGYLHLKRATDGTFEVERLDPATITLDRTPRKATP